MDKWPNFFIVGSAKCGTTSLYQYLKNVSEIFMSPVKEPNYFSTTTVPDNHPIEPIRNKEKYLSLFKKVTDEKIIGESSPSYLADPDAPKLIYKVSPDAKILISLRNPVERIYSGYHMFKSRGEVKLSFHDEIKRALTTDFQDDFNHLYPLHGLYYEDVKRYIDTFGANQVKIIIFEDWIKNAKETVDEVLKFLGVTNGIMDFKEEVHNPYSVPRISLAQHIITSPLSHRIVKKVFIPKSIRNLGNKTLLKKKVKQKMAEEDRDFLINFYEDDVSKLKKLLGIQLPWKDFP